MREPPSMSDLSDRLKVTVPGMERVPGWARFPWLRAGFSTREGGRSSVYGEGGQNLGWTGQDDPQLVAENRRVFLQVVGQEAAMELVTLQQVHGAAIRDVDREPMPLMSFEGKATLQGDGLLTQQPGRLLGVITADCVPVLVADTRSRAVAAFHAGWRGTLAGVVEEGIGRMREWYGAQPADLVAAIGPAIGACCFSVGAEVRAGFEGRFAYAPELFSEVQMATTGSELRLNLHEANRRQLLGAGVPAANITVLAECTACIRLPGGRRKYFSHRAERGFTGRMLSAIGVVSAF